MEPRKTSMTRITPQQIITLKDASIFLENRAIDVSVDLMFLAHENSNGLGIKRKFKEYSSIASPSGNLDRSLIKAIRMLEAHPKLLVDLIDLSVHLYPENNEINELKVEYCSIDKIMEKNLSLENEKLGLLYRICREELKNGHIDSVLSLFEMNFDFLSKRLSYSQSLKLLSDVCKIESKELDNIDFKRFPFFHSLIDFNQRNFTSKIDEYFCDLFSSKIVDFLHDYVESKGGSFSYITMDTLESITEMSSTEKYIVDNPDLFARKKIYESGSLNEYVNGLYSDEINNRVSELFAVSLPAIKGCKIELQDFSNGLVSVSNGIRTTTNSPDKPKNKVMMFGSSTLYGQGSVDGETIPSYLQRALNSIFDQVFSVENHSYSANPLINAINTLSQNKINPGDVVLFFHFFKDHDLTDSRVHKIDLNNIDRGDYFFIDSGHLSPNGNRIIAERILEDVFLPLTSYEGRQSIDSSCDFYEIRNYLSVYKYLLFLKNVKSGEGHKIDKYLEYLNAYVDEKAQLVGSISVNCNPITNGHLHLIEQSAKNVDKLFVFVIEEDLSFFKFDERINLVKESVKHLDNVEVLKGGKFICTKITYPEYFEKDIIIDKEFDASTEAWFFGEYIAEKLNIKIIFLGEEPNCKVTRKYNEVMKDILPKYGIDVCITERISFNDKAISASSVRMYLKAEEFHKIKQIVPNPTYEFLLENRNELINRMT